MYHATNVDHGGRVKIGEDSLDRHVFGDYELDFGLCPIESLWARIGPALDAVSLWT